MAEWSRRVCSAGTSSLPEGKAHVTQRLFDLIEQGDGQAIRFFLRARAGWTDRPLVEINQGGGEKLTIVNLLRRLDPLPDGLSEGCRRAYGELPPLPPPPEIEDMASANPDPDAPPLTEEDEACANRH